MLGAHGAARHSSRRGWAAASLEGPAQGPGTTRAPHASGRAQRAPERAAQPAVTSTSAMHARERIPRSYTGSAQDPFLQPSPSR